MPIYTELPADLREVDVIVGGGGTAACVIASRLADADRNLSILMIEQGLNNWQVPQVVQPALFPLNLDESSKYTLFWQGNRASQLADREPVVPSGGTLGGGSSINWMVYTRAQRSDIESWKAPGWSAKELLPFLKKFETYHGQGEKEHHGDSGPINVSSGTFRAREAENDFIDAADKLGYHELKDLQNLDNNNGTERWLRYVGPDGRRQDAAHRYLHPRLQSGHYPNLHVLCETQVVKVIFEDKRAVGVEVRPNPKFQAAARGKQHTTIRAKKLVTLSAGANATPLILERSGLGDPKILERAGVKLIEDLPGIGFAYQDHHLTLYTYRTSLSPQETINAFADGRWNIEAEIKKNNKQLGWNSMDASGKFRPTDQEVEALGPEFKKTWDRDFKDKPDRPLMIIAMYNSFFGDHSTLPDDAEYISMANWTAYPYSRGHIHITGPSITDRVDFNVGYLTDANDIDLKKHVWAYKTQREIFRRMKMFRGEFAGDHPRFSKGSKAAVIEHADGPTVSDNSRIQYTAEDDKAIEANVRKIVTTTWHSLGTAKMAPREQKGVVDSNLSVYGVKGLKLADLSVVPENVGANTNNTALLVGEKAADIIIKELGLAGKRPGNEQVGYGGQARL